MSGLHATVRDAGRQWKEEVLVVAGERFERRLAQEVGALRTDIAGEFAAVRTDMAKEFAALRTDMAKEFAAVRAEMAVGLASTRVSLVKWCFLFWVGQVAAIGGIMAFLLRTIVPR